MAKYSVTQDGYYPDANGVQLLGPRTIIVENPGGATVTLQIRSEDEWVDVPDGSWSAFTAQNVEFHGNQYFRILVSGFSAPFDVIL